MNFKKLLFYPLIVIFLFVTTLAFIPHYSCGCGDEGNNKIANGSVLTHHIKKFVDNVAKFIP